MADDKKSKQLEFSECVDSRVERREIYINNTGGDCICHMTRGGIYFTVYPDLSHNTDLLNSSIVFPGRAILEELILRIRLAAKGYIFPFCPLDEAIRVRIDPVEKSVVAALGKTHGHESNTRRFKFQYHNALCCLCILSFSPQFAWEHLRLIAEERKRQLAALPDHCNQPQQRVQNLLQSPARQCILSQIGFFNAFLA